MAPHPLPAGMGGAPTGRGSTAARGSTPPAAPSSPRSWSWPARPSCRPFGIGMVGPLLIQFGTDAQQQALPAADPRPATRPGARATPSPAPAATWPSLQLRAADDGAGHFVLNGQKTWTTYAQYADWIFCLVRTNSKAKKQEGISFLLVDMKTPGVTAKPMLTLGGTPAFCDTFFDNVAVPKENLVGPLNGGWTIAKALLGHERTLIAAVGSSTARHPAGQAHRRVDADGRASPLLDDPVFRAPDRPPGDPAARACRWPTTARSPARSSGDAPGPESSILKIRGSEILQQCYELAMDAHGATTRCPGSTDRRRGAAASSNGAVARSATCARPPSTAGPTRSRRTSSPRRSSACADRETMNFDLDRGAAAARRAPRRLS